MSLWLLLAFAAISMVLRYGPMLAGGLDEDQKDDSTFLALAEFPASALGETSFRIISREMGELGDLKIPDTKELEALETEELLLQLENDAAQQLLIKGAGLPLNTWPTRVSHDEDIPIIKNLSGHYGYRMEVVKILQSRGEGEKALKSWKATCQLPRNIGAAYHSIWGILNLLSLGGRDLEALSLLISNQIEVGELADIRKILEERDVSLQQATKVGYAGNYRNVKELLLSLDTEGVLASRLGKPTIFKKIQGYHEDPSFLPNTTLNGLLDVHTGMLACYEEPIEDRIYKFDPIEKGHEWGKVKGILKMWFKGNATGQLIIDSSVPGMRRNDAQYGQYVDLSRALQIALTLKKFEILEGKIPERLEELVPNYFEVIPQSSIKGREMSYCADDRLLIVNDESIPEIVYEEVVF